MIDESELIKVLQEKLRVSVETETNSAWCGDPASLTVTVKIYFGDILISSDHSYSSLPDTSQEQPIDKTRAK